MALVKKTACDKMEIVMGEAGLPFIQVRECIYVEDTDTGEIVGGKQYQRKVITPADDATNEELIVWEVAKAVHPTPVKDAYAAHMAQKAAEQANENAPVADEPI